MEEILRMVGRMWQKYEPRRLLTVGGSSRIPLLRRLLAERVREPDHSAGARPEDSVVTGSAMYAHQGRERLLIDVLSRSLGIMNADGQVVTLLRKGTPLPAEARQVFTACGSGAIEITIVQGERKTRGPGRILQTIVVDNASNGETVEVFFRVDGGGLLQVEVKRRKRTSRKTIALASDETEDAHCDLASEVRVREERLARLSMSYPDNFQARLIDVTREARSLKGEDASLQWRALEVLDRMISELEQVASP